MATPKDLPRDIGGFIRDLRHNARISLRQLAEQAGVSNPYLSQVERGLRKPSAEVLQQLASALRVSTPVMYLRAGLLDDKDGQGVLAAIASDPDLTMAQKQSLSQIYETFRRENARHAGPDADTDADATTAAKAAEEVEEQTLQSVAVTEAGAAPGPATEDPPPTAPTRTTTRTTSRQKTTPRRRTPRAGETEQAAAAAEEEQR
ncbi:helix-turn-helix domain-containing protein [Micromonospora sp. LOL_021]|uniref:helix-turn-helix domain-containing protein n=1 Tax=Micromonospora sp. LOL_021 TaxID=3345417 RepID=UPI003A8624A3